VAGTDPKHQADGNARPSQRRSRWWIAVLTFVAGIGVGVLIVGFLNASTPDFAPVQSAPPAPPSPTGSPSVPGGASARVNAACVRVINEAQDVATILSEVGPAITSVNLQQLDDIVRRLQSIEGRLENDLRDCRVEAGARSSDEQSPSNPLASIAHPATA